VARDNKSRRFCLHSMPMIKPSLFIVNGQEQDSLRVTDRGLAYGDGVFETMKVVEGDIVLWQYHYERLLAGLQRLYIEVDQQILHHHINTSLISVRQRQQAHVQEQGVLKLVVTRGSGQRGYMPAQDKSATLISIYTPLLDSFLKDNTTYQQQGVKVHICNERLAVSSSLAGIKSLNQLPYVLASRERQALPVEEGLLLDKDDYLIEATARNLFLVKENVVYTPLVDQCGVAGVMRRLIVDLAALQIGVEVKEVRITLSMLEDADEVFLSNSVSGIWPVISCVGGGSTRQWPTGKLSRKIQHYCHQYQNDKGDSLTSFLSSPQSSLGKH
jgi:4-amino-4-deoxychorismate lyase